MKNIDYYFSLLSPFSYLAGLELEEIARRRAATIDYKPIDLMSVFAETGGVPPSKRHWSRQQYRLQELRRAARARNLHINLQPAHWPTDPTYASQVVIASGEIGAPTGRLVHSILRAVWSEERDVSDPETVMGIVVENGVEADEIRAAAADMEPAYRRYTAEAIERGVFGSPFYVVGEERFWGQDRLSWLDDHLARDG